MTRHDESVDAQHSAIVNGVEVTLAAHPETPLLWLLRGELGCTSVKYGCGADQCGACTALVGGVATRTCALPLHALDGRPIETHEGLQGDAEYEAVVTALLDRNAAQCGYCLPGIVMTLVSLRRRGGRFTADEIARRLDDHLCRCGAHPRIMEAALECLGGIGGTTD